MIVHRANASIRVDPRLLLSHRSHETAALLRARRAAFFAPSPLTINAFDVSLMPFRNRLLSDGGFRCFSGRRVRIWPLPVNELVNIWAAIRCQ